MPSLARFPETIDAIVLGASAGGAEALGVLLSSLPARTAASLFVVLHLPRNRPSLLVDIFARRCALNLREAEDKDPVEPGTVYFAPPDYHMLIEEGPCIALSVDAPVRYSRPSIDALFESAAAVYRERLLGIILTGANDDGAAGLVAVHEAGGLAIVQDCASARAAFMPAAAKQSVPSAKVLSLDEIANLFKTIQPEVSA
ncbi:MAG: chemotaxis protein CheB [Rudaea sp.]